MIAFGSRALTKPERRYCVTRRELLAMVTFIKHFRMYLLGSKFTLCTDHGSLTWLYNFREPEGQLARWLELLQEYTFNIIHRQGRLHSNADSLSCIPCQQCGRQEHVMTPEVEIIGATFLSPGKMHEVPKLQGEDPTLQPVIKAKLAGTQPSQNQQRQECPATRRLYQLWDQLHFSNGILYCRFPHDGGPGLLDKLVVPKALRNDILEELHAGVICGHLGEEKTLNKLKERFYWPGQYNDVHAWCRTCSTCAARKTPAPRPRAPLQSVKAGFPMQIVAVDILGPLPESPAGNEYILVAGDYFTRWMEAYPIPNQEATTVATKLVNELFCRFSLPEQLHSDQGRQFESEILAQVCKLLSIEKTRTTPYHPQSDGLIERYNRTLLQMLSTCTEQHPLDWEYHLQKVCMAYNTSKQATTGYSPFFLMFGREARLPVDVMYESRHQEGTITDYVQRLKSSLSTAFEKVRDHVGTNQERQQEFYNRKVHGELHKPGSLVWLFNPAVPRGRAKKFHRPWTGPYRILAKLSDSNYSIQNVRNHKKKVVHFDRLKQCPANTRLPAPLSHSTQQGGPPNAIPPFPGTNLELVEDDEGYLPAPILPLPPALIAVPPSPPLLPPAPRYPTRSRPTPNWYGSVVTH